MFLPGIIFSTDDPKKKKQNFFKFWDLYFIVQIILYLILSRFQKMKIVLVIWVGVFGGELPSNVQKPISLWNDKVL